MEFRVLALGDVTSEDGTRHLARTLRPFQKVHGVDFTVVNGENVSGVGLTPDQAEDLFAAGADVITLGNHTWGKMQIADYLEDSPYILRPANFSPARRAVAWESMTAAASASGSSPSSAAAICHGAAITPLPQRTALLAEPDAPTFTVVDFHAQATSEKLAMATIWTAGLRPVGDPHPRPHRRPAGVPQGYRLPDGLGWTGAVESVLDPAPAVGGDVLRRSAGRFRPASGPCKAQGALFTLDSATGLCTAVERVDIR